MKKTLKFMSWVFTLTYGVRALYQIPYGYYYCFIPIFPLAMTAEFTILVWDLPAILSMFYMNYEMMKEL